MKLSEWREKMEEEDKKKNLRNFIDSFFPKGIFHYRATHILTHPKLLLGHVWDEIVFAWQRVFRGWDGRATWSIDYYIARQIVATVKELRRLDFGIPSQMFEGLPHDENWNHSKEDWEIARQRWHTILDEIVVGFEDFINDDKEPFDWDRTRFEKAFDLFREHFESLWW